MPVRVLHLIPSLRLGGAEAMLSKLVRGMDRNRFECRVVTMLGDNPLADEIQAAGIPVDSLGLNASVPNPLALGRFCRMLRAFRPQVLQTWLYHADLFGTLAHALTPGAALVWNIRSSELDMSCHGWRLAAVRAVNARLSRRPDLVIANSAAGRQAHAGVGFKARAWAVVPNGFDMDVFAPDPAARARLRGELGLADDTALIGLVARWDPQKDHETFVKAAAILSARRSDVAFVCVGQGLDADAPGITGLLRRHEVQAPVHLLGPRRELHALYPAFDIATLTSAYGEGFPNVVGEAMACSVPCVVTDVGDSAAIVGETGAVVPPSNPIALAAEWEKLIAQDADGRRGLGKAARERIQAHNSLDSVVKRYEEIYEREAAAAGKQA